jgi:diacylglycerol kinase (ATP)
MQRKIIYIINPISGTGSKEGIQAAIEKETTRRAIPYYIFPSVASGDYSFLHAIIDEQKITDVVVAGGDGTFSQVAGSLLDRDLNLGIIPCGSGNGLAFTAGIPKQTAKSLQNIFTGKASYVDGFRVNNQFACMLCGVGFDAQVAKDFAQQPTRGLQSYIRQVLKNFFSAGTYSFKVKLKNLEFGTDAYFISIANSNQYGNNFTIAPKASLSDGLLDVVIVTSQNKLSFVLQTFKQVAGWNKLLTESVVTNKKGVVYFQTNSISIINDNEAPVHIDGDGVDTTKELKIKVLPACFRLIQPA